MKLWQLLAHSHWFTINLFGRELRLCSRCSGYTAGFLSSYFLGPFTFLSFFNQFETPIKMIISIILILPLTLDWVSQSWGFRESNNPLRFFSGTLLGLSLYLFTQTRIAFISHELLFVLTTLSITFMGVLGKRISCRTCSD